jgi:hypothetical protein
MHANRQDFPLVSHPIFTFYLIGSIHYNEFLDDKYFHQHLCNSGAHRVIILESQREGYYYEVISGSCVSFRGGTFGTKCTYAHELVINIGKGSKARFLLPINSRGPPAGKAQKTTRKVHLHLRPAFIPLSLLSSGSAPLPLKSIAQGGISLKCVPRNFWMKWMILQ